MYTIEFTSIFSPLNSRKSFLLFDEAKRCFEANRHSEINAILLDPEGDFVEGYKNF